MKRIRKCLIHLLGGVTNEELTYSIRYSISKTGAAAADAMLLFMKNCHGLKSDEWCKKVYEHTCKIHERAMKELEKYAKSINY